MTTALKTKPELERALEVCWKPLPKQALALACPVDDVLFGGAVGGGKTDYILAAWVQHASRYGAAAYGLIARKTMPELREVMKRAWKLFPLLGAVWKGQDKMWTFPNGAILILGYLENEADAHRYWGAEYTFIAIDEAGHYREAAPIDALRSRLRTVVPGVRLQLIMTANPGGAGQDWLKKAYVDPAPPMTVHKNPENGLPRVYIPSRLVDNPYLMRDPSYVARVRGSGPKWLVRALLLGDWNTSAAGKIFMPEWWHWQRAGLEPGEALHDLWLAGRLPAFRTLVQAWDTDFGKNNDLCAAITLGVGHQRIYLLDYIEQSMKYPELERQSIAYAAKWKPSAVIIEDKASGQSLLQSLDEKTGLPLVAGKKGALTKEDHWLRNSPMVESGRMALFEDDPRAQDFANALQAAGTDAEHRDLTDAFAYAMDYIRDTYVMRPDIEDAPANRVAVATPAQTSRVLSSGQGLTGSSRNFSMADLARLRSRR